MGIDEEVHGFFEANNMVEGKPLRRRQTAYAPNGSDPSAQPSDFVFRPTKLRDVGEKGIDEEVHGFVSANNMVEGTPLRRRQTAYDYNGGEAHPAPAFVGVRFMNNKKDIGDKKIDPEVWGLVNVNNMVSPIQHARPKQPYLENGSDASAQDAPELPGKFKYTQKHTKDIGETGIDEEVHGFASANNMVLPIPHARRQEPYNPNGYVGWPAGSFAQKDKSAKDIGIHDVRPDVYVVVSKIINPVPVYRVPEAPKVFDEPWEAVEAKKAKEEEDDAKDTKKEEHLKASKEYHKKQDEERKKLEDSVKSGDAPGEEKKEEKPE